MEYISSYYRKQEEGAPGAVSLLLQHVKCGAVPVCLACVCAGERKQGNAYFLTQLLDWFYREGLKLCAAGEEKSFRRVQAGLQAALETVQAELSGGMFSLSGILCAGSRFVFFCQGKQRTYVVNTRFLRVNVKCLSGETKALHMESGILQPGIGILLATETFFQGISEEMLRESLTQGDLRTQIQADRHLGELGECAGTITARGAVLVCVRQRNRSRVSPTERRG